jgi:dolichol kinase
MSPAARLSSSSVQKPKSEMGSADGEMKVLLEDMAQKLSKLYKDGSKVRIRSKRSPNLSSVTGAVARAVESTAVMTTAPAGVPQALKAMSAALKEVSKTLGRSDAFSSSSSSSSSSSRSSRRNSTDRASNGVGGGGGGSEGDDGDDDGEGDEGSSSSSSSSSGGGGRGGGSGGGGGGIGLGGRSKSEEWALLEMRTSASYEHLAGLMRAGGLHVPQVRNFKLTRSLYHVSSALTMVASAELCWSTKDLFIISSCCFCAAWTTEVLKQQSDFVKRQLFKVLGFLTRDGEQHTVNSATWFMSGMLILALSFKGNKLPCCLGSLALGVGDPAAAFVGSKFGQVKIYGKKTLEGTAAFFLVNVAFNVAYMALLYAVSFGDALALCAVAALAGALAELYCPAHLGVDDNLVVPVVTAYAAWAYVEFSGLATPYAPAGVTPLPLLGVTGLLPPPPPGIFVGVLPWLYDLPIWDYLLK